VLSQARIILQGQSAYAHEQEALVFLRESLPETDPYLVWELVELLDPSTGRLLEIDAIVLGYSALYVVEIKSGPGVYAGDSVDWYRAPPGEQSRYMEPPYRLTNLKSKVLKGLIQAKFPRDVCVPWVQPLVFLSHQDVETRFRNFGDLGVVTRRDLLAALKNHVFPGADERERTRVNVPQMRAVAQALDAIGVRASKGVARVGPYELEGTIEEGTGYQDRLAVHAENRAFKRRARIYLVPQQTSVERRQQLRREADREASLLEEVKDHPNVLRLLDYVTDSPLGPTVLFDAFDGVPLDAFMRSHPDLSFDHRIQIIEQVGRALHHCHRKSVAHGALAPSAVLVREGEGGAPQVKLYNFQQGLGAEVTPTLHWSLFSEEPWALYQAPELRENPLARGPASDLFSLGALAYFVLTGRPPGTTVREVDERLARDHELDPRAVADAIPEGVAIVVCGATASKPINRGEDVQEWVEWLLESATAPEKADDSPEVSPLEARREDILGTDLLVLGVLGQGASSRVLEVDREGRAYALKVALTPDDDVRLAEEARILQLLRHARIVQYFETRQLSGRTCILMAKAGEQTLQRYLAREGAVSLDYASRFVAAFAQTQLASKKNQPQLLELLRRNALFCEAVQYHSKKTPTGRFKELRDLKNVVAAHSLIQLLMKEHRPACVVLDGVATHLILPTGEKLREHVLTARTGNGRTCHYTVAWTGEVPVVRCSVIRSRSGPNSNEQLHEFGSRLAELARHMHPE
jgi:serine/threonine protein kinase